MLLGRLIVHLHRRWDSDVAVGRKRLVDDQTCRMAMVDAGKLGTVGAGHVLILNLCMHGRGMGFVASRQLRRSGAHL